MQFHYAICSPSVCPSVGMSVGPSELAPMTTSACCFPVGSSGARTRSRFGGSETHHRRPTPVLKLNGDWRHRACLQPTRRTAELIDASNPTPLGALHRRSSRRVDPSLMLIYLRPCEPDCRGIPCGVFTNNLIIATLRLPATLLLTKLAHTAYVPVGPTWILLIRSPLLPCASM